MADMLATPDELRTYIDGDVEDARAQLALTIATALVQNACAQRLVPVADDVVELAPRRAHIIELPERPATAVALVEVTDHGATMWQRLDPATWQLVQGHAIWADNWTWTWRRVRVTYSHGFTVVPEDLKAVVLGIAMRTVTNVNGVRSEQIGSYSYTLAGSAEGVGPSLTKYERDVCNRYRRRTHAMR